MFAICVKAIITVTLLLSHNLTNCLFTSVIGITGYAGRYGLSPKFALIVGKIKGINSRLLILQAPVFRGTRNKFFQSHLNFKGNFEVTHK